MFETREQRYYRVLVAMRLGLLYVIKKRNIPGAL